MLKRIMLLGVSLLAVAVAAGVVGLLDGATNSSAEPVQTVATLYQNVQLMWFRWN